MKQSIFGQLGEKIDFLANLGENDRFLANLGEKSIVFENFNFGHFG